MFGLYRCHVGSEGRENWGERHVLISRGDLDQMKRASRMFVTLRGMW